MASTSDRDSNDIQRPVPMVRRRVWWLVLVLVIWLVLVGWGTWRNQTTTGDHDWRRPAIVISVGGGFVAVWVWLLSRQRAT